MLPEEGRTEPEERVLPLERVALLPEERVLLPLERVALLPEERLPLLPE